LDVDASHSGPITKDQSLAGSNPIRPSGGNPPVYLSAIASALGEKIPLVEIADDVVREQLGALHSQGLKHCRVTSAPATQLAVASARRTLDGVPTETVEAIVYCTDTAPEKTTTGDVWDFLLELGLPGTPATVVGGSGCGNLGPGLAVARDLILAGGVSTVLLVTADRVRDETRYLANGQTALSDGAASCLITSRPRGTAFRIHGPASSFKVDIGTATARPIIVAKATAQTIQGTVRRVIEPLSLAPADFRYLLTGNYGLSAQAFLATSAGIPLDQVYCPLLAQVGHCFSADVLLGLASLLETDQVSHGDRALLLAMSPRSWAVAAATYVAPDYPASVR